MQALVSEKAFQQQIIDLARLLGWRVYHTHNSLRSEPGFPDLVLARGDRCVFAEIKKAGANPTFEQLEWLASLEETGNEVYVWRPKDWPDIERTLKR